MTTCLRRQLLLMRNIGSRSYRRKEKHLPSYIRHQTGSYSLEKIRNGYLNDAWWDGGYSLGFTYDAWHMKLRIDHILYSPHFDLHNVHVEETKFSDHYPLVADFILFYER